MNVDQLLESYFLLKRDLRELEYQHDYLKDQLHGILDLNRTEVLRTPRFELRRSWRDKETIAKGNVPAPVWDQFSTVTNFPVLTLKPR
jgi:hypothetical protein